MADITEKFFAWLEMDGHQPLLRKVRGTARFDLIQGPETDHWLVGVDDGQVWVSRGDGDADCSVRMEKVFFERLVRGEENAVAAVLRGAITCAGDVALLLSIQRIFPGPPRLSPADGTGAPCE